MFAKINGKHIATMVPILNHDSFKKKASACRQEPKQFRKRCGKKNMDNSRNNFFLFKNAKVFAGNLSKKTCVGTDYFEFSVEDASAFNEWQLSLFHH